MLLKGKKAIITGGSRGIGSAIVKEFLNEGADVWIFSRSEGPHAEELRNLAKELGRNVCFKSVDMSDSKSIQDAAKICLEEAESIDILVNNAGVTRDGLLFSMKPEDWKQVIETNLNGVFHLCHALIKPMMQRRQGSIINVGSVVGIHGNVGQSNYAASKAGVIGFTKSLAQEVAKRGIRANVIAPGFIKSDMTDAIPEKNRQTYLEKIPMARFGDPEDVAKVALFLASDMSKYVTGDVLTVAGGMSM